MRNSTLKKEEVREGIIYRILSGEYSITGRIPPERELCELMNVSRITVRAAVDDLAKDGILLRDGRRGTLIKKMPGKTKVFTGKQKQFLFVYFSSIKSHLIDQHGASSRLYHGAEHFANENGYSLIVQSGENFLNRPQAHNSSVAGIITGGSQLEERLPVLTDLGVPVVAIDVLIYSFPVDSVCADNYEAGLKAAQKIKECKYRRPLFLTVRYEGEDFIQPCFRNRRTGFMDFNCGKGVEKYQYIIDYKDIFNNGKSLKGLCSLIKEKGIDSIVDCSDLTNSYLCGVNEVYKLPTIILGGVGENYNKRKNAELLSFDFERMGYLAAQRLKERIENPCLEPVRYLLPVKTTLT